MFSSKKMRSRVLDYQRTFSTESGKRVLHDLMVECHVLGSSFSKDPSLMAFKEGEKNVMLRIMKLLNININEIEEHIKEIENDRTDD
jgi:hypothetical protein